MQLLERLLPMNAMAAVRYVGTWRGIAILPMNRISMRNNAHVLILIRRCGFKSPHSSVFAQQLVGVGLTVSCLERTDSLDTIGLRIR